MNDQAKLAVCMPAYNAAETIRASIDSILSQTYRDFKFVITDDCSSDDTVSIVQDYDDDRIVLLQNRSNMGPADIRNKMLDYCVEHGFEYMALMDADDIAFPSRLQKQVAILDSDRNLSASGSGMEMEEHGGQWLSPTSSEAIKGEAIFANPVPTPMIIFRVRDIAERGLGWDHDMVPCDDYHLWYKFLYVENLNAQSTGDIQGIYKHSPEGVSHKNGISSQERKDAQVKAEILRLFGIEVDDDAAFRFMKVGLKRRATPADIDTFIQVALKLISSNSALVPHQVLADTIADRASWILGHHSGLGLLQRLKLYRHFLKERSFVIDALKSLWAKARRFVQKI
jgi:glycosyltransferase involved in cell wall biosynthesis